MPARRVPRLPDSECWSRLGGLRCELHARHRQRHRNGDTVWVDPGGVLDITDREGRI